MAKLFGGVLVFGAGLLIAVHAFSLAWVSGTPDLNPEAYQRYQTYSMIFGVISIGVAALGTYMVVAAIKRMNRKYRESLPGRK
jgi:ABC-type nitrate/sulfonate/bicarbonate transport system permease component